MDLDTIQKMWENDSKIDDVILDQHSLEIPRLHSKYICLLTEFKLLRKKKEIELRQTKHNAWLFYMGKEIPDEYVGVKFGHKVMKSDVDNWITVDDKVNKLELQVEYYTVVVDTLTEIIKQISNRTFQIKNAVEAKRFYNGYQ
jgi:hypothetical protein